MEKKVTVSVALATYNEQENLDRCLSSVVDWADEIIIVDGGSTDATIDIAKKFHAKVIHTSNPKIFHINKQKALDACSSEWILQLDADEAVSPVLAEEIRNVIQMTTKEIDMRKINPEKNTLFTRHQRLIEQRDGMVGGHAGDIVAFFVPRKNYFLGKFIKYAGTYPDGVIRIVKRGKAWFPSKSVHEQIQVNGRVAWLTNDLYHYSNPTLRKYFLGADKYSTLLANEYKENKISKNVITYFFYMTLKPTKLFILLYFRYKGFWDGFRGFLFCLFSALHPSIAYLKYILNK